MIKYQDNKNGIANDKFSQDELDRLKELQDQPLTEYQKKALMANAGKDSIYTEIDRNQTKAMCLTMSINDAKTEQLKSQDMIKASEAADSIIEAAEKDIYGSLINEGKNNIDDKMEENKEKADEAEKKQEERQEQIDEAKQKRKEEQDIIEGDIEAKKLEQSVTVTDEKTGHMEEAQSQVNQIMKKNNMINEDIKGIEIDLNF